MERRLLFWAERISLVSAPLVLFSVLNFFLLPFSNSDITFSYLLLCFMAIPQLVEFVLFQAIMIMPLRIPFINPGFSAKYYNKIPIERAEFVLEKLKNKAKERNDEEVLETLMVVKKS
jgi:hypothetical protein